MTPDLVTTQPRNIQAAGQMANGYAGRAAFADYQSRKADNTLKRQRADLALFAEFLGAAGIPDAPSGNALTHDPDAWRGITWGLVEGFRNWMLKRGYAVGSVNVRLSTVKTIAKLAAKAGALTPSEVAMIRAVEGYRHGETKRIDERRPVTRVGAKKAEAVTLSPSEVRRLKKQPDTPQGRRDALLVALLVDHGLRAGEVACLQVTDINLESGLMTFYRPKVDMTQTHQLTKDAAAAARRYFKAGDAPAMGPLLRASTGAQRLTHAGVSASNLSQRIRYLGGLIGIGGLSAHDLRHTWATLAARNGTALDRLQDAGGWASPAMPLRYVERAQIANEGVRLDAE